MSIVFQIGHIQNMKLFEVNTFMFIAIHRLQWATSLHINGA